MIFGSKKKKETGGAPSVESWAIKRTILALILALVLFFGVRSCYHFLTGWNAKMHKNFTGLPMGSLAQFAEESLGSPVRMSDYELETMPVQNYNELYDEAKKSGAVKFYYYENGMRMLYILGFDTKGKMVFKKQVKT
jgi:predicted peroxiredoxin